MQDRIVGEAREALYSALAIRPFGGEFVCARDRGQGQGDIIIYLLHPNPILLGRNIAGVWQHDEGGKLVQTVDVNPDEKLPKTGLLVRRTIVEILETEGFRLRLANAAFWPIWEREIHLLADGRGAPSGV
jgi:hypothetical protein